ncbi:MAG: hypothetical protein CME40_08005 [Haliea sp.]|nr:hypothetical protein [Haliea sp.]
MESGLPLPEPILEIAVALAIGLLVGSERGWHRRNHSEGSRVAGIRTFTVLALLGALVTTAGQYWRDDLAIGIAAVGFLPAGLLLVAGYQRAAEPPRRLSITTEVAAMLVYWLGVIAVAGEPLIAAASAVVLALLLHLKDTLHRWLRILDQRELLGTLQFLLLSVVMLPLLPDRDFGPWDALNPREVWWMVVLIAGLSLLGYFAMRAAGPRWGLLATALAGGIASSTAVTLSLSRLHRELGNPAMTAAGVLLASSTMYLRMLVVIGVLNPALAWDSLPLLAIGLGVLLLAALWHWRQGAGDARQAGERIAVRNPFELAPALQFGALLVIVMLASEALLAAFGQTGLYLLSVFTGVADVDAIVLSLAPRAGEDLGSQEVILCMVLAAATNTVMKAVYCRLIAGSAPGWKVLWPALLASGGMLALPLWQAFWGAGTG